MNIAELRALGRKINAENMAKAQVEVAPVVVSSNVPTVSVVVPEVVTQPVIVPVVESAREAVSNYVIIDEVPATTVIEEPKAEKKAKRRSVGSILGRIVHKKDAPLESFGDEEFVEVEPDVELRTLIRDKIIEGLEKDLAAHEDTSTREMRCNGCKKMFLVSSEHDMFKTGRCPECANAAMTEPVKMESAYGIAVDPAILPAKIDELVVSEVFAVSKKSKGLRAGGKKSSTADLGLDLSEVM